MGKLLARRRARVVGAAVLRRVSLLAMAILLLAGVLTPLTLAPAESARAQGQSAAAPTFRRFQGEPGPHNVPPGLVENVGMRSQGAKVFDVPGGGAHVAQIFSGPIHYRDERGRWEEIDRSIVPVDGGFRNGAHEFAAFFPDHVSVENPVEVDHGGASLSFALVGAQPSEATASGKAVTYPDVFEDADLNFEMTYDGYKENLVLRSEAAPATVTYLISTRGLELLALEDGRIEVRRGAGSVGFFPPFFAEEAPADDGTSGELTYDVQTSLRQLSPTTYELTASLDESWLRAPERRFPVVLDPSFVSSRCGTCPPGTGIPALKDASYSTGQGYMGWENNNYLRVGRDDTCCLGPREAQSYMTFDVSHEVRKVGNLIYEANFDIYNHQGGGRWYPGLFQLKRITQDWSEYQAPNPLPAVDETTVWSQYDLCVNNYCPNGWWRWNVRDIMQYWIDKGAGSNHGWRLSVAPGGYVEDMRDFVSKENSWPDTRPYVFVAVNAMPSTRPFTVDDPSWPYMELAPDALQNSAVVTGQPVLKIKDLTDTNQDPIVVRYQVSRSSLNFAAPDIVHDSGWIPETQQYTVPASMTSGTYYWRVMASDTCGAAYVDKDDGDAAAAGLCDDLSHDWGRPRVGAIERPISEVRWFSIGAGGASGMKAHVTDDIDLSASPSALTLDSVEGFSSTGGQATFEPDTSAREVFTYTGVDRTTSRLLGVTRTNATDHAEGTVVQAGSPPTSTQSSTDQGHSTLQRPPMGPYEVVPAPSQTWLNNHCVVDDPQYAAHAIQPLLLYSGYANAPSVKNYEKTIRDIAFIADRPFAEAHLHFQQHMRFVCDRNVDGTWKRVSVRVDRVPTAYDTNYLNTDEDPNNNYDTQGKIDCGEWQAYLEGHSVYGQADIRPMVFLDHSINTGGYKNGSCSFGATNAWKADNPKPGMPRTSSNPGTGNTNNSYWGYSSNDVDHWSPGASWDSGGTALQEFGHSIGLVPTDAPGHNPTDSPHHTWDFPDFMNLGYFHPSEEEGVRNNCRKTKTWERMTNKPLFVDCGRDTYWAPFASQKSWLCTHYNIASDSLYLQPRATRTSDCQA